MTAKLRNIYTWILIPIACVIFHGCEKDAPATEKVKFTTVKVYDDTSIVIPMEVVAGKGNLLFAYQASSPPEYRFMMTDNKGRHLWTKEFGLTGIGGRVVSGMVAEEDGTFTIFNNSRLINIDVSGNVLRDDPDFLAEINDFFPMHFMINKNGNYFIYGKNSLGLPNYAFAYEITHSGVRVFQKVYISTTVFTGCQQTPDGGYLFLGNSYTGASPTKFFVCKMNSTGNVDWIKYHVPPGPAINNNNYCFYTHDILASDDGNYFCFVGSTNPEVSKTSRVYKVTPDGELLDSLDIANGPRNIFFGGNESNNLYSAFPKMNGYCAVKRGDGTFFTFLNNGILEEAISSTTALRGNQAYRITFDDDLTLKQTDYLQQSYSDYFTSVCVTSDGKFALFGYISSFGGYNKPILLISE